MLKNRKIFFLGLIVISLAGVLLFRFFLGKTSSSKLERSKKISFLISSYNESGQSNWNLFLILYPKERRAIVYFANDLLALPKESKLLRDLGKASLSELKEFIKNAVGFSPTYTIQYDEEVFVRLIDLLGGLPFYLETLKYSKTDAYQFETGMENFSGEEIQHFALSNQQMDLQTSIGSVYKKESLFLATYDSVFRDETIFKRESIFLLSSLLKTNLSKEEIFQLSDFFKKNRISFLTVEIPAESKLNLSTKKEYLEANFDSFKNSFSNLEKEILGNEFGENELSKLEVLNGTDINGLGKRGKSYLVDKRYRILSVGNAWRNDFKNTYIFNRSGNTAFTDSLLKDLENGIVAHSIQKDLGIDATVVVGENFKESSN